MAYFLKQALWVSLAMLHPIAAVADPSSVRLGSALISYDQEAWKAVANENSLRFEPKKAGPPVWRDPVELRRIVDGQLNCSQISHAEFEAHNYDLSSVKSTQTSIGARQAERFEAWTGCRNATPRGVVVCIRGPDAVYLLSAVQGGCGGSNLFSDVDPVADFGESLSFPD